MLDQLGKDALGGSPACSIKRINDEQFRSSAGPCREDIDQRMLKAKLGLKIGRQPYTRKAIDRKEHDGVSSTTASLRECDKGAGFTRTWFADNNERAACDRIGERTITLPRNGNSARDRKSSVNEKSVQFSLG